MELELGLALPRSHAPSKVVLGFDLNGDDARATAAAVHRKKRGFTDAFGSDVDGARVTLPLFVWASAPRDDDNNAGDNNSEGGYAVKADPNGGGGGCAAPVGWPPVKSAWRNAGATRYVKVKMEGVAIGRKVDLSLHRSYATLLDAVVRLFTRNHGEEGPVASPLVPPPASRRHRTFTYQVGNGDWMLLGDVPWETFVKSVKRLKILSCGE